jgi:hypothetical protein
VAPSVRKESAITSPKSGGRSVGVVRWRTQTVEFFLLNLSAYLPEVLFTGNLISELMGGTDRNLVHVLLF